MNGFNRLSIIYATHSGRSKEYAEDLKRKIYDSNIVSRLESSVSVQGLNNWNYKDLFINKGRKNELFIFIVSTFGNGACPSMAIEFTDFLDDQVAQCKSSQPFWNSNEKVSNMNYTILALGSSNYPHFAQYGKHLEKSLKHLGAVSFVPISFSDVVSGSNSSFNQFCSQVLENLNNLVAKEEKEFSESIQADLEIVLHDQLGEPQRGRLLDIDNIPGLLSKAKELHTILIGSPVSGVEPLLRSTVRLLENSFSYTESKGRHNNLNVLKDASVSNPHYAVIIQNTELMGSKLERSVRHIVLETSGHASLNYEEGDAIAIYPSNPKQMVHEMARILQINNVDRLFNLTYHFRGKKRDDLVSSEKPFLETMTFWQALSAYIDLISPPSPSFLSVIYPFAFDHEERAKLRILAVGSFEYEDWIFRERPSIVGLFHRFSSLKVPLQVFFDSAPLMRPRLYSIASSPSLVGPKRISICVGHVKYKTRNGKNRIGCSSNFLINLEPSSFHDRSYSLPCYIQKSSFKLGNCKKPIIMVGAGTGLSPFRGFLQKLSTLSPEERGSVALFLGCRSEEELPFRKELKEYVSNGILTHFKVGYSRDPNHQKQYVTDVLRSSSPEIFEWMVGEEGSIYICGDILISSGTKKEFIRVLKMNGYSDIDALYYWKNIRNKRWFEDVFGSAKDERKAFLQRKWKAISSAVLAKQRMGFSIEGNNTQLSPATLYLQSNPISNQGFLSYKEGILPTRMILNLPEPFSIWEDLCRNSHVIYSKDCDFNSAIIKLPLLDANLLEDQHLIRAVSCLGILIHMYHYYDQPHTKRDNIPPQLEKPWIVISERLQRKGPSLTTWDMIFHNISQTADHEKLGLPDQFDQFDLVFSLFGGRGKKSNLTERGFFLIFYLIAYHCKELPSQLSDCQDAVLRGDENFVIEILGKLKNIVKIMTKIFKTYSPQRDKEVYGDHTIWAKTVGIVAPPIMPNVCGMSGMSHPFFQFIDVFLGRKSYNCLLGKEYLKERTWLVDLHEKFAEKLQLVNVRDFCSKSNKLKESYDSLLSEWTGRNSFLAAHQSKAFGYLEVSFKNGRIETNMGNAGGFDFWRTRKYRDLAGELTLSRRERVELAFDESSLSCPIHDKNLISFKETFKESKKDTIIPWSDVLKNSSLENGLFVVYKGKVFSLSNYVDLHEGGSKVVIDKAGRDCTEDFILAHGLDPSTAADDETFTNIEIQMQNYLIGTLNIPHFDVTEIRKVYDHLLEFSSLIVEIRNVHICNINDPKAFSSTIYGERKLDPTQDAFTHNLFLVGYLRPLFEVDFVNLLNYINEDFTNIAKTRLKSIFGSVEMTNAVERSIPEKFNEKEIINHRSNTLNKDLEFLNEIIQNILCPFLKEIEALKMNLDQIKNHSKNDFFDSFILCFNDYIKSLNNK